MSEAAPPAGARFAARFVAFALDASAPLLSYWLLLAALVKAGLAPSLTARWELACAFFLLYAAWTGLWLARAGATPGKRLLGLAVGGPDGARPSFARGALRCLLYAPSSVPFSLGFLWSLGEDGRAWHDLLTGTRVVEADARPRGAVNAAAALTAAGAAAAWLWFFLAAPRYYDARCVAAAREALDSLARLEEAHRAVEGRYASDLDALAALGRGGESGLSGLGDVLDPAAGVLIEAGPRGYRITARARDSKRTVVALEGGSPPSPGPRAASGS